MTPLTILSCVVSRKENQDIGMEEWDELRRQARTLEADIDHKLIAFNRLSVSWDQARGTMLLRACPLRACAACDIHPLPARDGSLSRHAGRTEGWRRGAGRFAAQWGAHVGLTCCRAGLISRPGACTLRHGTLRFHTCRHRLPSLPPLRCGDRCVRAAVSTCSPAAVHLTACDVSVLIRMRQLSEANESMGRCLRDMGSSGDSARLMHVLQRHRELLHEYEKECRKIKANIKEQRERDELLHSVRRDIGEFKTAAASRTDSLVRERASATNSLKTTDQLLKGAAATYESLKNQRQLYNSIAVKLSAFRSRLPSIDQLVGRIQKRKKTESIILAMVIAACAITVIYFAVLR